MIIPSTSHTASRSHVTPFRLAIIANEMTMPRMGTRGTIGVLNGLGRFGSRRRSTQMPAHTITNANRVPMLTISSSTLMGNDAASAATNTPTVMDDIQGVRNFGCTALNIDGSSPSFDIEKNTRDCPRSMTTMVLLKPMSAPIFTSKLPQCTPVRSMPTANGSRTSRSGYATNPVSTSATMMYRMVQMTSDPRMPMGMSLAGFFASCAAVETASNPM